MKTCHVCKQTKKTIEFHTWNQKNRGKHIVVQTHCKECNRKKQNAKNAAIRKLIARYPHLFETYLEIEYAKAGLCD